MARQALSNADVALLRILRGLGYEVREAEDGVAALEAMARLGLPLLVHGEALAVALREALDGTPVELAMGIEPATC